MNGIGPTIGNPNPGYGLRIRLDHAKAKSLASADWACPCRRPAEHAVGYDEVQQLVIRAERHSRDECPNEAVRAAAALRSWRRKQYARKRRK